MSAMSWSTSTSTSSPGGHRPNSLVAAGSDLRIFFAWSRQEPRDVTAKDVIAFVAAQRAPRATKKIVRISDGGSGLSSRTVARRLSSISGLYSYLLARGECGVATNPVPRGLATRRARRNGRRGVPLVRTPRLLPRILEPGEVDRLMAALRTTRDRAMVEAMVFGGLRRCEVLALEMGDLRVGERKVFISKGKGGHQRLIPMSSRFFASVARYLDTERPTDAGTDAIFTALKAFTRPAFRRRSTRCGGPVHQPTRRSAGALCGREVPDPSTRSDFAGSATSSGAP